MKYLVCVLCVLSAVHSALALDRNAFTFARYDLTLHLDPARQSLDANGKVTLRNDTAAPQRLAVLQISSTLDWKSITAAGKPVQYETQAYTSDVDHTGALSEAIVTLPTNVPPSGTIELEIAYAGTVPADSTRLTRVGAPAEVAARSDWDRISATFTAVRGLGYVTWYPIATEAASLSDGNEVFDTIASWKSREADSTMRALLCVPPGGSMSILANGEPTGASAGEPASCSRFDFANLGLISPTFAVGSFRRLDHGFITIAYVPGHELAAAGYAKIGESVQPLITKWFGPPRRQIQIVEIPEDSSAPYESGAMLLTPLDTSNPQQVELTMAHQLTHGAFESRRAWMYEGLAHFAQALEREQQEANRKPTGIPPINPGRKAAIAYMDQQLPPLVAAEEAQLPEAPAPAGSPPPSTPAGQPLVTATDEVFYRTKAMFVWWMLRDMVGDQALQRAIQAYQPTQDKEPAHFQRLLAAEAHRDLEWFFDDWVYRDRGLAEFHITSVYPRPLLPSDYSVTVTVENSGGASAEVPVVVRASRGAIDRRLEVRAREKAVLRVAVPDVPLEAIVNDGSVPEYTFRDDQVEIKVPPHRE
jgi:hypothetical protein